MKLLRHSVYTLMVCCSALWVVSSSPGVKAFPKCDSVLALPSDVSFTSEGNENVHSRSLSPWSWRGTREEGRIPSVLWEAECSSSSCSSSDPGHMGHDLSSVPIYQDVLVLRQQGRRRCYTLAYRSVAVGCTCIWTKTDQN